MSRQSALQLQGRPCQVADTLARDPCGSIHDPGHIRYARTRQRYHPLELREAHMPSCIRPAQNPTPLLSDFDTGHYEGHYRRVLMADTLEPDNGVPNPRSPQTARAGLA